MVACRRAESDREGWYRDGSPYWLHHLDGAGEGMDQPAAVAARVCVPAALPEVLDGAYRALLGALALSEVHRRQLEGRGFRAETITAGLYRTLPADGRIQLAARLVQRYDDRTLATIPGLRRADGGQRSWLVCGPAGLLVPVVNVDGRIVALKIRVDTRADGTRYVTLSSRRHCGPGPGSHPHIPLTRPDGRQVLRLTEGELKADLATSLDSILTVSMPGVASWQAGVDTVRRLAGTTPAGVEVQVALDADWATNPHVRRAVVQSARALLEAGFRPTVATWDATLGKGIDDLLAAGHHPTLVPADRWLDEHAPGDAPVRPVQVTKPAARTSSIRTSVREAQRGAQGGKQRSGESKTVVRVHQSHVMAPTPIFQSIEKTRGPRPVLDVTVQLDDDITIHFDGRQALSALDQSVFLAVLSFIENSPEPLTADVHDDLGKILRTDLIRRGGPDHVGARSDVSLRRLAEASGLSIGGPSVARLKESLDRLAFTGLSIDRREGGRLVQHAAFSLLRWATDENGRYEVAVNPIVADVIFGRTDRWVSVNVTERRALTGDVAKLVHAWLSAWCGQTGTTRRIGLDKLATKVWPATDNPETLKTRRRNLRDAVGELNALPGWSVQVEDRRPQPAMVVVRRDNRRGSAVMLRSGDESAAEL